MRHFPNLSTVLLFNRYFYGIIYVNLIRTYVSQNKNNNFINDISRVKLE